MIQVTIADAILSIDPDAKVTIRGDNVDTAEINWETTEI